MADETEEIERVAQRLVPDPTPEELALFDVWGRRIMLQAKYGNKELAQRLVMDAMAELHDELPRPLLQDTPILETGINMRLANLLEREFGAIFVGQLLEVQRADLLNVKGFAEVTATELYCRLFAFAFGRASDYEKQIGRDNVMKKFG